MDEIDENDTREANTPEPSAEEIKQKIKELKNRKDYLTTPTLIEYNHRIITSQKHLKSTVSWHQ